MTVYGDYSDTTLQYGGLIRGNKHNLSQNIKHIKTITTNLRFIFTNYGSRNCTQYNIISNFVIFKFDTNEHFIFIAYENHYINSMYAIKILCVSAENQEKTSATHKTQ